MDADGWDTSDDPVALIDATAGRVSARKWRLFLAAVVREHRRDAPPAVGSAVRLGERFADGLADAGELAAAFAQLRPGWGGTEVLALVAPDDGRAADRAVRACNRVVTLDVAGERLPALVREIVGNPFRWVRWEDDWLSRAAHAVAARAYAVARYDTLPVLADALEDAGCDNESLLHHLRGPGPHVRGCWALDVVLGKV